MTESTKMRQEFREDLKDLKTELSGSLKTLTESVTEMVKGQARAEERDIRNNERFDRQEAIGQKNSKDITKLFVETQKNTQLTSTVKWISGLIVSALIGGIIMGQTRSWTTPQVVTPQTTQVIKNP